MDSYKELGILLTTIKAGVSDWMVSVAMGSLNHGTFIAGFGALNHLAQYSVQRQPGKQTGL